MPAGAIPHPSDEDESKGDGNGAWDASFDASVGQYARDGDSHLKHFLTRQRREEERVRAYRTAREDPVAVAAAKDHLDRSLESFEAGSGEMKGFSKRAGYDYAARAPDRHDAVLARGHLRVVNSELIGLGVDGMQKWAVKLAKLKVLWADLVVPEADQQAFTARFTKRITPANVAVVLNEIEALEEDRKLIRRLNQAIMGRDAALSKLLYLLNHEEDYSEQHFRHSIYYMVDLFTQSTAEAVVAMHAAKELVSKAGEWGTCRTYFLSVQQDARRLAKEPLLQAHLPYPLTGNPLLRDTRRLAPDGTSTPQTASPAASAAGTPRRAASGRIPRHGLGPRAKTRSSTRLKLDLGSVDEGGTFEEEMDHGCGEGSPSRRTSRTASDASGSAIIFRVGSSSVRFIGEPSTQPVPSPTATPPRADLTSDSDDPRASQTPTFCGGTSHEFVSTLRRRPWTAGAKRPPLPSPPPTYQCCTPPVSLRRKGNLVPQLVGKPGVVWKKPKKRAGQRALSPSTAVKDRSPSVASGGGPMPSLKGKAPPGPLYGDGVALPPIVFEAEDLLRRASADVKDAPSTLATSYAQIRADALEEHIRKPVTFLQKVFRGHLARKAYKKMVAGGIREGEAGAGATAAEDVLTVPLSPLANKGPNSPSGASKRMDDPRKKPAGDKPTAAQPIGKGKNKHIVTVVRYPREVQGCTDCYMERLYWVRVYKAARTVAKHRAARHSIRAYPAANMSTYYPAGQGRDEESLQGMRVRWMLRKLLLGPVNRGLVKTKQAKEASRGYAMRRTRLQMRLAEITDEKRVEIVEAQRRSAAFATERLKNRVREAMRAKATHTSLFSGLAAVLDPLPPDPAARTMNPFAPTTPQTPVNLRHLKPIKAQQADPAAADFFALKRPHPAENDWSVSRWFLPPPFKRGFHPCCISIVATVAMVATQLVMLQHERQRANRLQAMMGHAPSATGAPQQQTIAEQRKTSLRRNSFRRLGAQTMSGTAEDSTIPRLEQITAVNVFAANVASAMVSTGIGVPKERRPYIPQRGDPAPHGWAYPPRFDAAYGWTRCKEIGAPPTSHELDRIMLRALRGCTLLPPASQLAACLGAGLVDAQGERAVGFATKLLRRLLFREDVDDQDGADGISCVGSAEDMSDVHSDAQRVSVASSRPPGRRRLSTQEPPPPARAGTMRKQRPHAAGGGDDGASTKGSTSGKGDARRSSRGSVRSARAPPTRITSPLTTGTPASLPQSAPSADAASTFDLTAPLPEHHPGRRGFQACGNTFTWTWLHSSTAGRVVKPPPFSPLGRPRPEAQPFLPGPGVRTWVLPLHALPTVRKLPLALPLWTGVVKPSRLRRQHWGEGFGLVRATAADYQSRFCYHPSAYWEKKLAAAVTVQCAWRVYVATQEFYRLRKERLVEVRAMQAAMHEAEQNHASRRIQKWWLGIMGERRVAQDLICKQRAVVLISNWYIATRMAQLQAKASWRVKNNAIDVPPPPPPPPPPPNNATYY